MENFNLKAGTIYLRLVHENDAAFICSLRNNDQLNTYISKSTADEEAQPRGAPPYQAQGPKSLAGGAGQRHRTTCAGRCG